MSKLIDYFVICGLDYSSGLEPDKLTEDNLHVSPLERSYKGKVLAHYPNNVQTNPFDESAVCMFSLPAGLKFRTQKHSVTQAPNFHSYIITREDGKRCFGFSLIFYEEVQSRDIKEAMHTLQVQLPTPGKSLLVHLPPSDPQLPPTNVIIQNSLPPLELPHHDYPLRLLFLWLGVDIAVQLFTCLLLEYQVLLRSTDPQKLMVVAEGITSLLFPFTWPHVYVPIMPASLHHFLDAPVPFLMGLYATSENLKVASEANLCYVDIDKCKVQLPEEMAAFPHLEPFTAEIWSVLDKYSVHEIISRSSTLPGRPHNLRKLSIHDTLDNERPPSPPGSARSEALQRIADIVRRTGVTLEPNETNQPSDSYFEDLRFNNALREIFLNRFVHIFQSYENFVIFPNQDKEDWFNNRDSMQNFDKASFLSDQPEQDRMFLWRFLESQMFATLIDNKILSIWGEVDCNLTIFDNRIKVLKKRFGNEMRSVCYEPCINAHDTQKPIDRRLAYPDFESPLPREILSSRIIACRQFPILDNEILNKTPIVNKGSIPRASALKKGLSFSKPPVGPNDKNLKSSNNQDVSPAVIAQANWTFVEKLLKDCKAKTKRMLLAKLGAEGVTLSSGNNAVDSFGAVEESTLITSLCDFLERVWSHGLQKKRSKSALWSHLLAYQEKYQYLNKKENHFGTNDVSSLTTNLENWSGHLEDAKLRSELPELPSSILFDITNIQAMTDVKTAIGMARAWVRLALEKKQLSKHFRTLLSDQSLLRTLYKRLAFVRSEEEREQFLYHLLSLNAVDYFCFTCTYPTTVIPYRIVIVPNKKGTTSSANVWMVLSGTLSETNRLVVPKATLNLNIRFPCGRWLGRGVDDGSTERLLVGSLMSRKEEVEEITIKSSGGSLGRSTPRSRSPAIAPRSEMKPSQIQHMLGDCVNKIIKWHHRRTSERHTTLTALLCSDNGLVFCLENVFLLGFKSARLFMGKHYLWDYFVRVKEQFEMELLEEVSGNRTHSLERNHQETVAVWREHLLHRMLVPMSKCKVTQEMYEENSFLRKKGLLTFLWQILLPLDELDVVLEKTVSDGISSPSSHI
ncbi:unnamed protein product [Diabrotica balteata]|uniref:DENN domain-containing protein 5B n=1 Tax=Diabrotica balteata TaxID=107213 RepID=A0A9N9T6V9_DIABA|nr:unnamed protein product [Diabrotica balteata]